MTNGMPWPFCKRSSDLDRNDQYAIDLCHAVDIGATRARAWQDSHAISMRRMPPNPSIEATTIHVARGMIGQSKKYTSYPSLRSVTGRKVYPNMVVVEMASFRYQFQRRGASRTTQRFDLQLHDGEWRISLNYTHMNFSLPHHSQNVSAIPTKSFIVHQRSTEWSW